MEASTGSAEATTLAAFLEEAVTTLEVSPEEVNPASLEVAAMVLDSLEEMEATREVAVKAVLAVVEITKADLEEVVVTAASTKDLVEEQEVLLCTISERTTCLQRMQ